MIPLKTTDYNTREQLSDKSNVDKGIILCYNTNENVERKLLIILIIIIIM